MSTSVIEPGTRLAGRYRLEERVAESGGSTMWRAIDEILARAVSVRTFEPDFPRAAEVVTAARTASRLTDPRLTQVFDADDTGELAYVVSEWVNGESLEEMIAAEGPLEAGRAATFICEAAEALSAAHNAGLSHLCLTARNLVWTTGGTVKLTGLGVDAVLCGINTGEPARIDALGLGQMLYAALTGHWPGTTDESDLPCAPSADGELCSPRQVRSEVPAPVDLVVCRAMEIQLPEGKEPLTTPAEVAAALAAVPRTPLPLFSGPAGPPPSVINRPPREAAPQRTVPAPRPAPTPAPTQATAAAMPSYAPPPGEHAPVNRKMIVIAGGIAALVVAIAAWQLSDGDDPGPAPQPQASGTASPSASSGGGGKLTISSARGGFELNTAVGSRPDGKAEITADRAIDGKSSTFWETDGYRGQYQDRFGNYLKGVGLVLDLGKTASVNKIILNSPSTSAGAHFEIRVGNSSDFKLHKVGSGDFLGTNPTEITLGSAAKGQYVVIWFTKGPTGGKLQVGEVSVHGSTG